MLQMLEELNQLGEKLAREDARREDERRRRATVLHTVRRPEEYLGKGPFKKVGVLHFYREGRLNHFLGKLRAFDRAEAERVFGNRISELSIADAQGNLFTCYADMRNAVIAPGESVEVEIRACKVPIPKLSPVFLCHFVERRGPRTGGCIRNSNLSAGCPIFRPPLAKGGRRRSASSFFLITTPQLGHAFL